MSVQFPVVCPCCGADVHVRRTTALTEEQCLAGYVRCVARGYTRDRLLAEQTEVLDLIAPGMTDWLRDPKRMIDLLLPGALDQEAGPA